MQADRSEISTSALSAEAPDGIPPSHAGCSETHAHTPPKIFAMTQLGRPDITPEISANTTTIIIIPPSEFLGGAARFLQTVCLGKQATGETQVTHGLPGELVPWPEPERGGETSHT